MTTECYLKEMVRDVFYHMLSFIDPVSTVSLSLTCKMFKPQMYKDINLKLVPRDLPLRKNVPREFTPIPMSVRGEYILMECIKHNLKNLFEYWSFLTPGHKTTCLKDIFFEIGALSSMELTTLWMERMHTFCIAKKLMLYEMNGGALKEITKGVYKSDSVEKFIHFVEDMSDQEEEVDEEDAYTHKYRLRKALNFGSTNIANHICTSCSTLTLRRVLSFFSVIKVAVSTKKNIRWFLDTWNSLDPKFEERINIFVDMVSLMKKSDLVSLIFDSEFFETIDFHSEETKEYIGAYLLTANNEDVEGDDICDGLEIVLGVAKEIACRSEELFEVLKLQDCYFQHAEPEDYHTLAIEALRKMSVLEFEKVFRGFKKEKFLGIVKLRNFSKDDFQQLFERAVLSDYVKALQTYLPADPLEHKSILESVFKITSLSNFYNVLCLDIVDDNILLEMIRRKKVLEAASTTARGARGKKKRVIAKDTEEDIQ